MEQPLLNALFHKSGGLRKKNVKPELVSGSELC